MDLEKELQLILTRRQLYSRTGVGIGAVALGSLLNPSLLAQGSEIDPKTGGLVGLPHFASKAK
ncbi:MAG TPA: sulfatase, partial [Terriglobia bacterium]|nr:sulfatase [Terriglobia bacterium]